MAKLFSLEVHSPYHPFFHGMVEAVTLTLADGEIGIYADHTPVTAPVLCCILRIKDGQGIWKPAFISEGILEVTTYKTMIIVDDAQWPEEIDRQRALADKDQAEKSLESAVMKFQKDNAEVKIRRAVYRLKALEMGSS